jgi:putative phosphoesterase
MSDPLVDTRQALNPVVGSRTDACNWLVPPGSQDAFCAACRHDGTVPDLSDPARLKAWRAIENAKHRLIYSLTRWRLPLQTRAGGDIGKPDLIAELLRIAPVTAIRGNIDTGQWAEEYPETEMVRFGGRTIYVLRDVQELRLDAVMCGVDVVVSGHSHRPRIETIGGVLYLNPGSAGPRRFNLPVTLATLDLTACGPRPLIHDLGVGA